MRELFFEYLQSDSFKDALNAEYPRFVLSDMREKTLRHYANSKEPLRPEDVAAIAKMMGKGDGNVDPYGEDDFTEDMVEEYAENLRNFLYTYKDEATDVDPSIDPNEEHRGPMAQDIEKVAPDCVKETAQGVKVVDGDRLALVNAGVIGDLARRVLDLEATVNGRQ